MDNMEIYKKYQQVPQEAQREIKGGKLKGFTDINPMWRIKALTEFFGPCGIGWRPVIVKTWTERGEDGRIAAFMDINLYVKYGGEWSEPIPGTGGSMFCDMEKGKLVSSDEAFKSAFTDALSVCCKLLGIGADVYWSAGSSKYKKTAQNDYEDSALDNGQSFGETHGAISNALYCEECGQEIKSYKSPSGKVTSAWDVAVNSLNMFGRQLCGYCVNNMINAQREAEAYAAREDGVDD